jgi:hypothetical protein
MAGVDIVSKIVELYNYLLYALPPWAQTFINLFLVVMVVVFYAFFIWKVYTSMAKKNILGLDLNKYNKSKHPFLTKIFAGLLYFVEYIIILPFLIFFWFGIFAIFLILLTESLTVSQILVVSAVIIVAIRIASYYKEKLAEDLAKLIPFTLLGVSLLNPAFFNFEAILTRFQEVPAFFSQVFIYLIFIILFEIILRLFDFGFSLFGIEEPKQETEETAQTQAQQQQLQTEEDEDLNEEEEIEEELKKYE